MISGGTKIDLTYLHSIARFRYTETGFQAGLSGFQQCSGFIKQKPNHPQFLGLCELVVLTAAAATALIVIVTATGILSKDCLHGFFLLSVGFMRTRWNT
jgi:hypothetical protein